MGLTMIKKIVEKLKLGENLDGVDLSNRPILRFCRKHNMMIPTLAASAVYVSMILLGVPDKAPSEAFLRSIAVIGAESMANVATIIGVRHAINQLIRRADRMNNMPPAVLTT
jgi:hypothetical protein